MSDPDREFWVQVRRAILMVIKAPPAERLGRLDRALHLVVAAIEKRYGLTNE
jgi:hypothetical protein